MTDTIGWGGDRPPPRRRRRWRRPVLWVVVALVVAGVVAAPSVKGHFAREAAAWVQRQWGLRAAYDDARAQVVDEVSSRAGATDTAVVDDAARVADREEATRLEALAQEVEHHRTWSADVAAAAREAARAMRFEAYELRRDASSASPTIGYYAPQNTTVIDSATALVARAATAHGLPRSRPDPVVHLAPATAQLALVTHTTDVRTGLQLVVAQHNGLVGYDLDTGARQPLPSDPAGGFSVTGIGSAFVVGGEHGVSVTRGQRTRTISTHPEADYRVVAGDGLWLQVGRRVRYVNPSGRAGAWFRLPDGYDMNAATRDALVLTFDGYAPDVGANPVLWTPATGTRIPFSYPCGQYSTTATEIVFAPCRPRGVVTVYDVPTGRTRDVRVGHEIGGFQLDVSPDGRFLNADLFGSTGDHSTVIDLPSGRVVRLPQAGLLRPVMWSPDSHWLLLGPDNDYQSSLPSTARYALWSPTTHRLFSVRLRGLGTDSTAMALLTEPTTP